ncbi:PAS domain-containing protein [Methylobacterium crusticola]|uniref:PAS domain-containing protein n=1 Tax=Methylobacterium crusticola TaxID=1697972 RepID=UPI001396957E|nr:PAS domain-containing protein [Methylobacterium crusticola]
MSDPLAFSSGEFMRLLEGFGLTGTWGWRFRTGEQVWSPGLYRILGLPESVEADYALLLSLVHPDDRDTLEDVAQVVQGGVIGEHTVRIIRPDGRMRAVVSRGEVYFSPDGQPTSAAGVVIDATDRERLVEIQRAEQQRRLALSRQAQVFIYTETVVPFLEFGPEFLALTGLRREDLREDWVAPAIPEEHARWRQEVPRLYAAGKPYSVTPTLRIAGGGRAPFRMTLVPLRDAAGAIESWTLVVAPLSANLSADAQNPVRRGLDQAVEGRHLRAARGLLDWTLNDLAQASGLSLSTVRRLEEDAEGAGSRSRPIVLATLRSAGILFTLIDGNTVAVARVR